MEIVIETDDTSISADLMGVNTLSAGKTKVQLPGGASLIWQGESFGKATGFENAILFTLEFASSVRASLVAAWLYDKLKNRKVRRLRINRTEVTLDKGEITRVLREEIEEYKDGE
jgi:hypothetical protein